MRLRKELEGWLEVVEEVEAMEAVKGKAGLSYGTY